MKIDKIIDDVCKDLPKVQAPPSVNKTSLIVSSLSLGFIFGSLAALNIIRQDWLEMIKNVWFCFGLLSLFITFYSASNICLTSAIPGRKISKHVQYGLVFGLLGLLGALYLTYSSIQPLPIESLSQTFFSGLEPVIGFKCSFMLIIISLIPGLILYGASRNLAPVKPSVTAQMIGFFMGAMGALALAFHCVNDNPVHTSLYHGLPILILAILGIFIGRKIFPW